MHSVQTLQMITLFDMRRRSPNMNHMCMYVCKVVYVFRVIYVCKMMHVCIDTMEFCWCEPM